MSRRGYERVGGYARQARAFERMDKWTRHRIRNVLGLVNPRSDDLILDLGCGMGTFTVVCSKLAGKAVGLDFSTASPSIAKRLIKSHGNPLKAEFVCADVQHLPFKARMFSKIICADLVEHLYPQQYKMLLLEAHRVLRMNGVLTIYTPNPTHIFEFLRKHNLILKQDPTHVSLKSLPHLIKSLKDNFTVLKAYYTESHVPFFNIIERILMEMPTPISKFFKRRICLSAVAKLPKTAT